MLSAQDLGVEITVPLAWDGLGVGLAPNFYADSVCEGYVFWNERVIEGI